MSIRTSTTADRKGAAYYIFATLFDFIFKVVLFYSGWHLLALYNIVSGEPSSGWNWLLATWAITSRFDRFVGGLQAQGNTSGTAGFWGPYRRQMLVAVVEAVGFSTVIYHLGWLSIVDASDYAALLTAWLIGCVLIGIMITAGRLRDRPWLAAIDDVATGVVCAGSIPFAYWCWLSSNDRTADDTSWYVGIAICAAIGGGINLWRKSFRNRQVRAET